MEQLTEDQAWLAKLRAGADIAEFALTHMKRNEDTGEVMAVPKHEITQELAIQYAPSFRDAVKHPEYELDKDATGLDSQTIQLLDLLFRARLAQNQPNNH